MAFIKDRIIYKRGKVKVYINQCHNKGKKINVYAVRRDDETGRAELLGSIEWCGRWWQYVFSPEDYTQWNPECMRKIADFMEDRTTLTKLRWTKNRKKKS